MQNVSQSQNRSARLFDGQSDAGDDAARLVLAASPLPVGARSAMAVGTSCYLWNQSRASAVQRQDCLTLLEEYCRLMRLSNKLFRETHVIELIQKFSPGLIYRKRGVSFRGLYCTHIQCTCMTQLLFLLYQLYFLSFHQHLTPILFSECTCIVLYYSYTAQGS